ncbi:pentapeptide repeat-containing protein [Okeania sp.]|uniref:pentapeptide repeat-containing protein n=1 Tax=Okeania sp. TaxID=3100323 RepID=UPI002B4B5528|nr:pentapeptide repeat-containing protein [Okeania sp.]MEB3342227.1 pentapeptide repeat-containing protein [Okeania sp.]
MNRRQREILQLYSQGELNFQGANLRGLSFQEENLSGADFSFADLRGTNFSGAKLTGAKFCGAKAGLQKSQIVVLLVGVFVLFSVSVFLNVLVSAFILLNFQNSVEQPIAAWVSLVVIIIFWITFICEGIEKSSEPVAATFAGAVLLAGIFLWKIASAGIPAFLSSLAAAVGVAFVFSGAFAFTETVSGMYGFILALILALAGAVAFVFVLVISFAFLGAMAGVITLFQTLLSAYVAYQAIKGDERYVFLRNAALTFAAVGGTSFRDANLTDADFTNATLKGTDFTGTEIIRTCWKNTIKLDYIRPGKTYLKDAKVRELVKTGQGENINLDRFDLQGIDIEGANLTNASFIEANLNSANLQDANLSRAKLVGTFLDQANLTGATLTGAFLEDWGITTTTKLDGIKCDYVYMRLPPDKRPDFLKLPPEESLDERVRRKPADEDKNFEEGEFTEFIKPLVNILDLYHNQGVDPRIAAYSFEKLQKDHPEAEIKMRSMEVRGENNDKLLIRADTKPEANHSVLDKEYFDTYNNLKALSEEQLLAVLAEKEKDIEWYKGVLSAAVHRPSVNIENNSNKGNLIMSESSGDHIHAHQIDGAVANKGGSYGVGSNKGEIKDSKIAGTIYESQEQNLAQAAKDIQELLEQLDETYPSDTMPGKVKIAEEVITQIDNNPTKAERIFNAIKAGGVAAFEQFLNHPASSFVIAALEDWQKTK